MSDILITSSILILTLLLLRWVFRGVVSRRVQYALWGLVLVRLLLPTSLLGLFAADFSVLTAVQPVQAAVEQRANMHAFYSRPVREMTPETLLERDILVDQVPTADDGAAMILASPPEPGSATLPRQEGYLVRDPETNAVTLYADMAVGPWDILDMIWKAGMAVMGIWFVLSNARFYGKLRKNRRAVDPETAALYAELLRERGGPELRHRVYLVDDGVLPSPCLFGGAVYLTPAALQTEESLRHVLTHEETHARHLDPLWSLLRCVCLTVYWFDPLVWIAAACSKTDCELACDEGALARLGEDERIPYGKTLLSLIPVKKGPSDPLLSATTMTAGKKQLKDRITRIAQNPRQLMAAVLAVAALATVAAACTFTGANVPAGTAGPVESGTPSGPVALTGAELEWFNREFFNSSEPAAAGYQYNIRNQFANPINLYDAPENIDLYELFYLEGSAPSDKELETALGYKSWDDLSCPAYKLTKAEMDELLKANMGLTLAETAGKELDGFTYDDGTDAYYWMHGDTNYCGNLDFLYGARETTGGSTLVKLYHNSNYAGSGWYCVTLSEREAGSYWFVSNQTCEHPAIPPVLPAGDPAAAISLKDLEPYTTEPVELENRPESDFDGNYENRLENWNFDGHNVMVYRTVDGIVRSAVKREDGSFDVFLTMKDGEYGNMFFYNDLFGRDGFTVTYRPGANARFYSTDTDYYYFDENGVLVLLARCNGESRIIDLDGDGTNELIAPRQLFFQRDGLVYEAQMDALLLDACPELSYWDYESWDVYSRCLYANGLTEDNAETGLAMWERYLYFDGENILVYKGSKTAVTDHVAEGADAGVPTEVVEQAKAYVEGILSPQADGTWLHKDWEQYDDYNYVIDDWRIESFPQSSSDVVGDAVIKGWAFNYEMHTPTPEKVTWAGGMYVTEDGWVSPGYPGCDWLFYHDEGGKLTYLEHAMINDMSTDSVAWRQFIEDMAESGGIDIGEKSYAALQVQYDLDYLMDFSGTEGLYVILDNGGNGGGSYFFHPDDGNARNRQVWFTQPDTFRWRVADSVEQPTGASLTITDPTWHTYLRFFEGSDLVMSKKENQGAEWYVAEPVEPDGLFQSDIFSFMRLICDEAEFAALQTAALAAEPRLTADFTDGFKLYDWSKAWATQYELAHAQVTSGSSFAFSWQKVIEVEVADQTDTSMSIWYILAFTPENDLARKFCWAGNTREFATDFPNPDPEWGVPEGALYYGRVLRLEKQDGTWTIVGAGTG